MANNSWLRVYGSQPMAIGSYEFVWVRFSNGENKLKAKSEVCNWSDITHWQPTQIRTPKPLTV